MHNDDNNLSRRSILGASAAAGVVLVGCGDDAPMMTGPNPDVAILNALLTAEYGAIKAYDAGIAIFTMPPVGDPQAVFGFPLASIAGAWKGQHQQHAAALAATITSLGGMPVTEASVSFQPPATFTASVANVMKLAANAEKGAAIAYKRAIKDLTSAGNRFLAANIEGDETQHFVVLNALLQQLATPNVSALGTMLAEVVPKAFVARQAYTGAMAMNSLEDVMNLAYTAM